jgi:hypothetical protein
MIVAVLVALSVDGAHNLTSGLGRQLGPNAVQVVQLSDDLEVRIGLVVKVTIIPLPIRCQRIFGFRKCFPGNSLEDVIVRVRFPPPPLMIA